MADKEDKAFAIAHDLDKDQTTLHLSNDDFVLPLLIFSIIYGIIFSAFAVVLNAVPPQLWSPSPIMIQIIAFFRSMLSDHIDLASTTSLPLDLPVVVYHLPAIIYAIMNILLLWLLKPQKRAASSPRTTAWIPGLSIVLSLGMGALVGLTFWEEVLVLLPLTMSLFVLPWYFCMYKKRVIGAEVENSAVA